jgi:hypothetical protein
LISSHATPTLIHIHPAVTHVSITSYPIRGVAETLFQIAFQITRSPEHLSPLLFTNHTVAPSQHPALLLHPVRLHRRTA